MVVMAEAVVVEAAEAAPVVQAVEAVVAVEEKDAAIRRCRMLLRRCINSFRKTSKQSLPKRVLRNRRQVKELEPTVHSLRRLATSTPLLLQPHRRRVL